MADGPTVDQIIKKRAADISACEAQANSERRPIENSYTLNLPALEYVKGLVLRGPTGLKAVLLGPIEGNERVCKHKALLTADLGFATREAELQAETAGMRGLAEGRNIVLAGADKATEIYKNAFRRERTRAVVAEAVATACLIPQAPPEPEHRQSPQLLAKKR